MVVSSSTSFPASMMALTLRPRGLFAAIAERKISPVLMWGKFKRSFNWVAKVPLPAPGGPKKMYFII
jgi:hypothetical protein